jgi:hypothetical protein
LLEGTTLLLLVFIAASLKRFGGQPFATAVMGPINGLAFLLDAGILIHAVADGGFCQVRNRAHGGSLFPSVLRMRTLSDDARRWQ